MGSPLRRCMPPERLGLRRIGMAFHNVFLMLRGWASAYATVSVGGHPEVGVFAGTSPRVTYNNFESKPNALLED